METNTTTGKQTISNNIEYENYSNLEEDINKLIETLEFDLYTPVTDELINGLKEFEQTIYKMRLEYDKNRLNFGRKTKKKR